MLISISHWGLHEDNEEAPDSDKALLTREILEKMQEWLPNKDLNLLKLI